MPKMPEIRLSAPPIHYQWTIHRIKPNGETTIAHECDSFKEVKATIAKLQKVFPTHEFTYKFHGKYVGLDNEVGSE